MALRYRPRKARSLAVLLAGLVVLGSSCASQRRIPEIAPESPESPEETQTLDRDLLEQQLDTIEQQRDTIEQQRDTIEQQRDTIRQLEHRLLLQQRLLDDAIQEVVRAKAKQRSVESRAEAASGLAEAEIALKSFRAEAAGRDVPELTRSGQLLELGNEEFERQNFGGTLYLSSQAKSQISVGRRRLSEQGQSDLVGSETPFAVPLSLTVRTKSNFREGPGQSFGILDTLKKGTPLTAYSSNGSWLRVVQEDGTSGWIHESLVDPG
jgi:hypothetical protein